jgi:asparagine synthase (glutamine-hydrolysing)
MCGIVGLSARRPVDVETVSAAILALRHRGPDGHGVYVDDDAKVGLGHARLSIIDLSDAGAQPMHSADGRYVLTFNGEIYNYRELRSELVSRGCRFRGGSDSEVLLEGYALLGPAILNRLNGIFAFAIHDTATDEVFVARDQLGIKPLYYAETSAGVAFASEIKALFALVDLDRTIDVVALRRYLTFLWCPGDRTLLRSVRKLEPGTAMTLRGGAVVERQTYWRAPEYSPRRDWSARDCAEELRDAVDRCVARQLVADVPVGAFLSGGLDSTAIVAAARNQAPDIHCFTIDTGAQERGSVSDLPYARTAAAALGVHLEEVRVDSAMMCERLSDMPRMLDEPLADPACLNVLFIAELARSHGVKVLLSGAGGDDLFTGYRRHTALAFDGLLANVPRPLRAAMGAATARLPTTSSAGRRLKKLMATAALDVDHRIASHFAWGPLGIADELLAPDLRHRHDEDVLQPLEYLLDQHSDLPAIEKCLLLERRFFLADHNLTYTDKMSMVAGVETRVPLIDLELVNFAATVPVEWKHRRLTPKWILKKSQEGRLPASIINRPKTGFGAPLRNWMRHEMRDLTADLLSPATLTARGLFDPEAVGRLQAADARGECDGSYTLFSLMCVELWCRDFIDGSGRSAYGRISADASKVRRIGASPAPSAAN